MPESAPASVRYASRLSGGDDNTLDSASGASERSSLAAHTDSTIHYGAIDINDDLGPDERVLASKSQCDDEETQLLLAGPEPPVADILPPPAAPSPRALLWIIAPMMLAVFLSNADGTIVMATHAIIASEFMSLESSSWLFTGFVLASTATQTTLGQLSEIFGRKPVMMFSYLTFGLGLLITGTAQSMVAAIVGRLLSGAVSAGNDVLVTLVVTDLLPLREVAAWRSYINVIAVIGRCVGGPLGGWMADVIGWRLSFIGQAPFFLLTLFLCWVFVPNTKPKHRAGAQPSQTPTNTTSAGKKLGQVDFLGSFLLAAFLILLLLPIEFGGNKIAWTDPQIPVYFGLAAVALGLFIVAEKRRKRSNQLLPLSMFRSRHTVSSFLIILLQLAAQLGMMFTVPLYFQVTQRLSSTSAGARLLPAVIGNACGGIVAGSIIRTTGKYKWLIFLAAAMSASAHALMILRWHGHTSWWESLYIFPGGFGTGVTMSALFVAVQVSVDKAHIAPAVSMVFLASGLGTVLGLAGSSAVYQAGLRSTLESRLVSLHLDAGVREQIIANAVASVDYIRQAKGEVASAIMASYVDGLWYSHFVSLFASLLAFALAALLREYKI